MDENRKLAKIRYNNVFFKSYVFSLNNFEKALNAFDKEFVESGLTRSQRFFFSIDDIYSRGSKDPMYKATFYQPAKESAKPDGCNLGFVDALIYNNMIYRVVRSEIGVNSEAVYDELMDEARGQGKKITSSFFHEYAVGLGKDGNKEIACVIKARMA